MAYHDLNDNAQGFPLGAQIEILGMQVRQYEGNHWQLQRLDLANIRSLTPRNRLLQPISWQVGGGLERVPGEDGQRELVGHLSGCRRQLATEREAAGLRHGYGAG